MFKVVLCLDPWVTFAPTPALECSGVWLAMNPAPRHIAFRFLLHFTRLVSLVSSVAGGKWQG